MATLAFVRHSFQYVADHKDVVRATIDRARERAIERGENPQRGTLLCLRQATKLSTETMTVLGYEKTGRGGAQGELMGESMGEPTAYEVLHDLASEATLSVRLPFAYLVPADAAPVLENLRLHGIVLEELATATNLEVEAYVVESITRAQREYERHLMLEVEVEARSDTRSFPAGTVLVRTGQPLGSLAAYLLELQSEDGLCAWNFFDEALSAGADFPVLRLPAPTPIETRPVTR
jgi:hypothetical protein